MPKRPVRYEKQKKARERALKERKALSYEDVPLEQYDQEEIKLKRPPKKVIRLLLILVLCSLAVMDITKKWTGRRQDWSRIHAQLSIYFA